MRLYRRYIRYFVIGFILAALAFGSVGIQMIGSDTSADTPPSAEQVPIASPSECQPNDTCCPKSIEPPSPDAAK